MTTSRLTLLCTLLLLAVLALVVARSRHREAAVSAPAGREPAGLQAKPIHALRVRDSSGSDEYLARNLVAGPIEVRCKLEAPVNMSSDPPLPRRLVLPAMAELPVTRLHPADPGQASSAAVACEAMIGDPGARPAENLVYALPFPAGTSYTLDQGFDGRFSHHDPENRFALDFGVPEGTPVLAARGGVVMQVEEDFRASGSDAAHFGDRANYVRILHEDGSMAVYAHLAPGSMLRQPGDHVVVGQLVGKSGRTGFATGPHLHFAVQRNAGMALLSIPFAMTGVDPHAARD